MGRLGLRDCRRSPIESYTLTRLYSSPPLCSRLLLFIVRSPILYPLLPSPVISVSLPSSITSFMSSAHTFLSLAQKTNKVPSN